jgi:ribosomal protein S18 acetylase RimI-like enzyme
MNMREIMNRVRVAEDDDNSSLKLTILPKGQNPAIGPETGTFHPNGISLFFQSSRIWNKSAPAKAGSYRFVYAKDGEIVAGMQIISDDGKQGHIANIYTAPSSRRQGLATALLAASRKILKSVSHSPEDAISGDGKAWKQSLGE